MTFINKQNQQKYKCVYIKCHGETKNNQTQEILHAASCSNAQNSKIISVIICKLTVLWCGVK